MRTGLEPLREAALMSDYAAQEAHLLYLWDIAIRGKKNGFQKSEETVSLMERFEAFIGWVSKAIWRCGEDPLRPVLVGIFIIFF